MHSTERSSDVVLVGQAHGGSPDLQAEGDRATAGFLLNLFGPQGERAHTTARTLHADDVAGHDTPP